MMVLDDRIVAEICWTARIRLISRLGYGLLPDWEIIPRWRQDLMTQIVQAALRGQSARQLHEIWWGGMASHGRRFGPEIDIVTGTNPMMRDWDDLTDGEHSVWHLMQMMPAALSVPERQVSPAPVPGGG